MREFRVTNRTQGRLEIKEVRKVLDAGESAIIAEPLPESVRYMMGGGPSRKVDVTEIQKTAATKAAPAAKPPVAEAAEPNTERQQRGGKKTAGGAE